MSLPVWKCETCGKKFTVNEWLCADGQSNHVVANREYLLADAPSDPGHPANGGMDSRRDARTLVCGIPPDERKAVNGEVTITPGGYAEFIRGRFSTTDPQKQYYLDKKGGFCSEAQWENAWLSQGQQIEMAKMKLASDRQRLENDRNELLEQQKQRVSASH